jgi:hypothetical protein
MAYRDDPEPARSEKAAPWSEGQRTTVSFLLFVHLFALFVAVASNAGPVSPLRRALRVPFLMPYLQMTHMDLAYNFHLTHATEWDTDHMVEIETWPAVPSSERMALPEEGIWPGIRTARFQNLSRNMALLVGQEERESVLPLAVSRGLFAQRGISSGRYRFRLVRHFLVDMEGAASMDPARRDPFHASRYSRVYEADLKFAGGQLLINKAAAAGETAPTIGSP